MSYRTETDTMGKVQVPAKKYWGAQTQRSILTASRKIIEYTIPRIELLKLTLNDKSMAMADVIKIGRTHFMDATPITLAQEFSGYVSQLAHGIKAMRNTLPHLSELAMGGSAVGTGLNTPEGYDREVASVIPN